MKANWVPTAERQPSTEGRYLVVVKWQGKVDAVRFVTACDWWVVGGHAWEWPSGGEVEHEGEQYVTQTVTHWAPLPDLPEEAAP